MKKSPLAACAIAALLLASCGKSAESPTAPTNSSGNQSAAVPAKDRAVKDGDIVAVDYVGKLEDGTLFDTSVKSEAEKAGKLDAAREYAPLLFSVGAGSMIKGFDRGVVGMKVGEKKTLRIPPEEAYGTGGTEEVISKEALQDKFTQVVPRERYKDQIEVTVPESTFTSQGRPVPKVGEPVTAGVVSAMVTKSESGSVTLRIENRQNPFYGKKLAVGLSGDFEGNVVKIKKLDDKNVTVEVDNKVNPFYGKKLAVGLSAKLGKENITIRRIDADTVTIERAGELVGKTLVFDIEVKEIK